MSCLFSTSHRVENAFGYTCPLNVQQNVKTEAESQLSLKSCLDVCCTDEAKEDSEGEEPFEAPDALKVPYGMEVVSLKS